MHRIILYIYKVRSVLINLRLPAWNEDMMKETIVVKLSLSFAKQLT